MAAYFKIPRAQGMLPTVPRDRRLLPRAQDRLRDLPGRCASARPGFRRYANEEVAEHRGRECRHHDPVRLDRPGQGQGRRARGAAAGRATSASRASSSTRPCRASIPTTARPTRSTKRSPRRARSRCSIPARPASARACAAAWGCGSNIPTRCYLDDVAADFPDMPIILAHPSFPWQEEALAVATHKPNVYIDLSGWSPKYFPPILVQLRQHAAEAEDAVRLGLAGDHAGPLAGRLREDRHPGRGPPADPQGKRGEAARSSEAAGGLEGGEEMNRALRFAALAASLTLCAGVADARELRVAPGRSAGPPGALHVRSTLSNTWRRNRAAS